MRDVAVCTRSRLPHARILAGYAPCCTRTSLYIGTRMSGPSCGGTAASLRRQYFTTNVLSSSSFPANRARARSYDFANETMIHSIAPPPLPFVYGFEDDDGIIARINGRLHCSIRNINRRRIIDYLPLKFCLKIPVEIEKVERERISFLSKGGRITSRVEADLCQFKRASRGPVLLGRAFVPL